MQETFRPRAQLWIEYVDADKTAERMGVSRSRFFALAVEDFLRKRRCEEMLDRLNEVYSSAPEPAEAALLDGIKKKVRRSVKERW